jgi:peptidoglycan/LPS O-acetylase OafA/YrhL
LTARKAFFERGRCFKPMADEMMHRSSISRKHADESPEPGGDAERLSAGPEGNDAASEKGSRSGRVSNVRLKLSDRWRADTAHAGSRSHTASNVFPGLDLLRGFAAVSVVVYHCIELFEWRAFPVDNPALIWFRVGWIGVDLFFVISGFVITLSALRLRERNPAGYAREFRVRRLARIVPLHYATCLIFVLFLMPHHISKRRLGWDLLGHLTFTHNLTARTCGSINGPNWSVGVEMQFYLLVVCMIPLLKRARPLAILGACIATAWAWRAVMFALFHGRIAHGVNLTWLAVSQVPGMLDEFGFGIALALVLHGDVQGRVRRLLQRTRWLWPLAATVAGTVTMHIFWKDAEYWNNWRMVVLWRTLLGATCVLVVISACAINDPWFRALTAPLRYLGTISYGIYLWHALVIATLKRLIPGLPGLACCWTLAVTLALAAASWHIFEKPLMARFAPAGGRASGPHRRQRIRSLFASRL